MDPIRLTETPAKLGEGPCWHEDEGVLYWVDILGKRLHRHDPSGKLTRYWQLPEMVGTVAPRASGGLLLALQSGLAFFDPENGELDRLPIIDANPRTRFNDGKCDPQGRFWFGSMDIEEKENLGILYSMDLDGKVKAWIENIGVSNGMTWSPDGKTMYYIDSPTRRLDTFDFDSSNGSITNRRNLVTFDEEEGFPDGMTRDSEGYLWIAHWAGGCISKRCPASGERLARIPTHAYQTSACCFGGPELIDLYITSAQVDLTESQQATFPQSGHLFKKTLETPGSPTFPYRG
ncbi:MAG: SMP-30/gluconolactonase/LRE family protein [Verrucomicrobiales bacterium]|jgi:sugar lactone lactonase YvrE|nr:SMP-30/gluconolactonase/LRE family protein [bacterium]MDF1784276.1 SMP-30/gluconolactonase/LRE family protein [Verrucomicrobiales bacterium]